MASLLRALLGSFLRTGTDAFLRLAPLRGHVHKRGTSWCWVLDVGHGPVSGERRLRTKSGFATKKEAESAVCEMIGTVEAGTYVSTTGVSVGEYLAEWIETTSFHGRTQVRASTRHGYNNGVKRLTKQIGGVKLQALTPLQVESCYGRIMKAGGKTGGPLAPKTVKGCHIVLHRALSDAERLGLVPRNVAHVARSPAVDRKEAATWSAEELSAFLQSVEDDRLYAAYVVLATTGMRRGELFGLRWSDLDLDRGRLSIAQSLLNIDSTLVIEPTKTNRSRRSVALDPGTVDVLRAHRRRQAEERLAFGAQWNGSYNLVFCKPDGTPEHPDMFSRRFKQNVKAAGLPALRGPHNLRHTWATLALKAGVHPKIVSDRLGHATIAVTIDTYSHVTPSMDADAADLVAASIFGAGKVAK